MYNAREWRLVEVEVSNGNSGLMIGATGDPAGFWMKERPKSTRKKTKVEVQMR